MVASGPCKQGNVAALESMGFTNRMGITVKDVGYEHFSPIPHWMQIQELGRPQASCSTVQRLQEGSDPENIETQNQGIGPILY